MNETPDVQNPAWLKKVLESHQLMRRELSRHLEQEQDRFFDIEQACNRALKLIKRLDGVLGANWSSFQRYIDHHESLMELLRQLTLDAVLEQKLREAFGEDCFSMNFFSQAELSKNDI